MPLLSSLGMNHEAHTGMTLGSVLMDDGGFFLSASSSSLGVTRYDEKFRRLAMMKLIPFEPIPLPSIPALVARPTTANAMAH